MKAFWAGVFDRLILSLFLLVITGLAICSPKLAVKVLDDFSED